MCARVGPASRLVQYFIIMLCTVGVSAQVRLDGVRSGFVLDEAAKALRPVIGTPGSAYLGPVVPLPFPIQSAEVRGASAIVIADSRAYLVRGLDQLSAEVTDLAAAERAFLDDAGNVALLAGQGTVRLVIHARTESEVSFRGALSAVTFVDDCAVIASKDDAGTALYRLCADRPTELLWLRTLDAVTVDLMTYTRQGGLFLADRQANRVQLIRGSIESGPLETLAAESDGITGPLGMVAIGAQEVLIALGPSSKAVVLSARAGVSPVWIELPVTPDRLAQVIPNRLLSCTSAGIQPLLVIDLLQENAPFFIPVARGLE